MRMGHARAALASLGISAVAACAGCGLSLDFDPPDRTGLDGGAVDAFVPKVPGCETDVDCDDADACDGREACVDGACVEGEPIACPDDDVCDGTDACVDGECVAGDPPSCPAEDGDPCNGEETCDPIVGCTALPPPSCDDGVDCTVDACEDGGCVHAPSVARCEMRGEPVCDPVLGCQYGFCDATVCASDGCSMAHCEGEICRRVPTCRDAEACCAGACVPMRCDDGDDCTADACGPTGCMHTPTPGRACDDGDACTVAETCTADGRCAAGATIGCVDGDPCTTNACDPVRGCVADPAPDGTPCNDGDECSGPDRCEAGACVARGVRACLDDANPCTDERCDPVLGCTSTPTIRGAPCGMPTAGDTQSCDGAGHCCGPEQDCDGDGVCECAGRCVGGTCSVAGCRARSDCVATMGPSACCVQPGLDVGYCYDEACLSCCRPVAGP